MRRQAAAILLACRPVRRVSRVDDAARAADRDRRVPRRRHRDQRPGRRCVRDDRGRGGAGRRRRAARPLVLARALQPAARTGHPAVHRDHAGDAGRCAPASRRCCPPLEELLRGRVLVAHNAPFDRRVLRRGVRADRPRVAEPAGPVHRGARAQAAAAAEQARAERARRRARDRGADRAPRARRRRDVRPRAVRAVPAAVRERADDRRRGGARGAARRRRATGRKRRDARRSRPPPQLDFAELPTRPGRVPVPRRRRPGAVRRQVGLDPQPRPRPLRARRACRPTGPCRRPSSTTRARTRSSARSCSRTA